MTRRTASRRSSLATRSNCALLGLASGGVYRADRSPDSLVRSYRTVSPLPRHALASQRARSAVCFLWHCPGPCERWALPTTVSCEARTFLGEITQGNLAAAARPAPRRHCTGRLRQEEATLAPTQGHRLFQRSLSVPVRGLSWGRNMGGGFGGFEPWVCWPVHQWCFESGRSLVAMVGGSSVVTWFGGDSFRCQPRSRSGDCPRDTIAAHGFWWGVLFS